MGFGILIAGVGILDFVGPHRTLRNIIQHILIGLHVGGLRTHFHRHVADGHAARHVERIHIAAGKVDGLIHSAVRPDLSQHGQHHVFGVHALGRFALQPHFDDFWHPEPQFPRHQDGGHVCGPAARAHGPESPMGGGVAVGSHDDHAGVDHAGFRHHLMAHAAVGVEMEFQIVLLRELPHFLVVRGTLDIRARRVMVKDEGAAGVIPHLFAAHLIERVHRLQVQVVDFGKVHLGSHDLSGAHFLASAVLGQNLFDGVHKPSSLLSVRKRILNIVYDIQSEISISQQSEKCKLIFSVLDIFPHVWKTRSTK